MKALIYINKEKDEKIKLSKTLISVLESHNVSWQQVYDDDMKKEIPADVLFVLGGDGTILYTICFACRNNLPIIGINTGHLGFLTEFDTCEIEQAVELFLSNKLQEDKRILLNVNKGENDYFALNDVVVQRIYTPQNPRLLVNVEVKLGGDKIDTILGDGVIVSTPTGSTAYSLSCGGSILAPEINAFSITPISAHSLHKRPITYSADTTCELKIGKDDTIGLFIDGKFFGLLSNEESIKITKSNRFIYFLRRKDYNFYKRVVDKLRLGEKKI